MKLYFLKIQRGCVALKQGARRSMPKESGFATMFHEFSPNRGRAEIAAAASRDIPPKFNTYRGVAQLVARLLWEQDAAGSSPVTSTITALLL